MGGNIHFKEQQVIQAKKMEEAGYDEQEELQDLKDGRLKDTVTEIERELNINSIGLSQFTAKADKRMKGIVS